MDDQKKKIQRKPKTKGKYLNCIRIVASGWSKLREEMPSTKKGEFECIYDKRRTRKTRKTLFTSMRLIEVVGVAF